MQIGSGAGVRTVQGPRQ